MILFEAPSTETQKRKVEDLYAKLTLESIKDDSSLPPFFTFEKSYDFFCFTKLRLRTEPTSFLRAGVMCVAQKDTGDGLTLRCGVGLCAERANESNTQTSRTCVMPLSFGRIINSQHLLRSRQVADVLQSDRNFYANHRLTSTNSMRCNTFKRYNFQNFYGIANSSRQASVALICEHTTQGNAKISTTYDLNGSLIYDGNQETEYRYNVLGMPLAVKSLPEDRNGEIAYSYDAMGNRLSSSYKWSNTVTISAGKRGEITKVINSSKKTEYAHNKVYRDGKLDMILLDNGYIQNGVYYFYNKDHLGNNIAVHDQKGNLVQQTFYHPYGKPIPDFNKGETFQPYKYGGKEEETMFGLEIYDFHARQLSFSNESPPMFTTMDPALEDYYPVSPYAYCLGNPLRNIDPDGRDVWTINSNGTINHEKNKKIDRIDVVDKNGNTTKGTEAEYGSIKHHTVSIKV